MQKMKIALFFHLSGVVIWVGGMFFAYVCLRPVAGSVLEPPQRLRLWSGVFARFFPWVWASVAQILVSGLYMLYLVGAQFAPLYAYVMAVLGLVMMLIFGHVYFAGFGRLRRCVAAGDWPAAGAALGRIRVLVGVNLVLGALIIATATLGAML
jgi:uncharacterized membrane protein